MKQCKAFIRRCRGGILAALAAVFITLVYGPLELYFTNREDFWFAPKVLLPEVLFLFAAALAACLVLLAAVSRFAPRLYPLLTGSFLWLAAVCYIHSNFLSGWLPSMDGTAVDWSAYPGQRAVSIAVCAAAALLIAALAYKKWLEKAAVWAGSVLTLMLLVTVVTLGIGSTSTAGSYYYATTEGLREYSTDKNFVIFVVDSVDGNTFEQLVNATPEYQDALQDFTYYNDALCAYPHTYYAVPQILSGEWYEGQEDFEQFRSRVLRESPLFESLTEQNYKMGIYLTDTLVDKNAEPERFFNMKWEAPKIVSHPAFWRVILRMSCVKNAPFDFKRLGYSLPEKLNGLKLINKEDINAAFTVSDRDFLQNCQDAMQCDGRMFKYIHIEGAHGPLQYGPHLEDVSGTEQATYENQVAGTIYVIENYLNMLRENGTYDNTAIVIMSDHGDTIAKDPALLAEGHGNVVRAHSIFLAKGFGEKHAYQVNEAPFSYADLQSVFEKLLNGSDGKTLIDWKKDQLRERRFMYYEMGSVEQTGFEEMRQVGRADDWYSFEPTGNIYKLPKEAWK